jgi:hypothetical protein
MFLMGSNGHNYAITPDIIREIVHREPRQILGCEGCGVVCFLGVRECMCCFWHTVYEPFPHHALMAFEQFNRLELDSSKK